ncbi:hypothetical protein [Niallia oryzisoli]|uniref:hypothetical protein n=1 Tax=Niallia oryzisoli TaxID=1737571 RepID=UPI00373517E1
MTKKLLNINNMEGDSKGGTGNSFKGWDIAIWITPIPILGYGITFSYEWGVSRFYEYPTSFISLDSTTVAKNCLILVLIPLFILIFPELIRLFDRFTSKVSDKFLKRKRSEQPAIVERWMRNLIISFLLVAVVASSLGKVLNFYFNGFIQSIPIDKEYKSILSELTFGVLIVVTFLAILILYWGWQSVFIKKNYVVGIPVLTFFLLTYPYFSGFASSVSKYSYYVIEGEAETYIVLNFVKDKLLIAPLDLKNGTITPEYSLIEAKTDFEPKDEKDGEQLTFNLVNTGTLSIGKVETIREVKTQGPDPLIGD